jgi:hypothetical protein
MMWMFASRCKFRLLAIGNSDLKCVEVNVISLQDVIKEVRIERVYGEEGGFRRIVRLLIRK